MEFMETGSEGVDWMHLIQDRDQWWALVNTVMELRSPSIKANEYLQCVILLCSVMNSLMSVSHMKHAQPQPSTAHAYLMNQITTHSACRSIDILATLLYLQNSDTV
jgi:hypothetical protein